MLFQVIDHYENPRNVGSLDKKDKNVGTGLVGAPACGDVMKLQIRVDDDGKIIDAKFKTFGCGSAIASSSLATEWVKGKTVDEALKLKNTDIAKELSLPPVKLHCSSKFVVIFYQFYYLKSNSHLLIWPLCCRQGRYTGKLNLEQKLCPLHYYYSAYLYVFIMDKF